MERKIGEIFEYNGDWYQAVDNARDIMCNGCGFANNYNVCEVDSNVVGNCGCKDGNPLIFKKLEKVGEPFRSEKGLYQHYKVFDIDNVYGDGFFWCVHNYQARTLTIELKQNKEDMEEKKLNLKPFDIQKAREGKPVCTRDGRKARIICFDYKGDGNAYPILALISNSNLSGVPSEIIAKYTEDGKYAKYNNVENNEDLMMLPEKKEMWINIYKGTTGLVPGGYLYDTEEEAKAGADMAADDYITTVQVSWEE